MSRRPILLGACVALALAGCATREELAARHCSAVAGPVHDQCVADELAKPARPPAPPPAGGGGY
jgi:hypothetical protein